MPPSDPQKHGLARRAREVAACLALLVGIVAAGLTAQAVGLDTKSLPVALVVVAVGVFVGVGLRKVLANR